MTLNELHNFLNGFLKIEEFRGDPSLNGIQIQNSAPETKQIRKVAFAVDACEQTALQAAAAGADALVVHHGLFWGRCETVTGTHYKRISAFLKNDLALLAYHIPLDANNPYGNNFGLAGLLGLQNIEEFGEWRGMPIGAKGMLTAPLTVAELAEKLGISQKHLSDIETGTKFPSAGLIEKLAKELNVSVAFLFGGSDPSVSDISNNVATLIMNQLSPTLNDMSQDVEDIKKMLKNLKITM